MKMTEKQKKLEGLVAAILNARELVINLGQTQGVRLGMKFAVLAETPLEISDPTSGEVLDTIDREKVRVEASEVRDKVTICRTYRIKKIPGGMLPLGAVASMVELMSRPPREVTETLLLRDSTMPPPLSEEESHVKIKDRVVQVPDE
jgi:hypothetical protein